MPLQEIIEELDYLEKDELSNLKGRINVILADSNRKKKIPKVKEILDKDIEYIKQILILKSSMYVEVPSDYIRNRDKYTLDPYLNDIAKELKKISILMKLTKAESVKLCKALLEAGLARIEEMGKTKSFRILVYTIHDVKSLLEEEWPGYFGSKLWKSLVLR
jgi:hypothetical protein